MITLLVSNDAAGWNKENTSWMKAFQKSGFREINNERHIATFKLSIWENRLNIKFPLSSQSTMTPLSSQIRSLPTSAQVCRRYITHEVKFWFL